VLFLHCQSRASRVALGALRRGPKSSAIDKLLCREHRGLFILFRAIRPPFLSKKQPLAAQKARYICCTLSENYRPCPSRQYGISHLGSPPARFYLFPLCNIRFLCALVLLLAPGSTHLCLAMAGRVMLLVTGTARVAPTSGCPTPKRWRATFHLLRFYGQQTGRPLNAVDSAISPAFCGRPNSYLLPTQAPLL
jgi:hypothetical protein